MKKHKQTTGTLPSIGPFRDYEDYKRKPAPRRATARCVVVECKGERVRLTRLRTTFDLNPFAGPLILAGHR